MNKILQKIAFISASIFMSGFANAAYGHPSGIERLKEKLNVQTSPENVWAAIKDETTCFLPKPDDQSTLSLKLKDKKLECTIHVKNDRNPYGLPVGREETAGKYTIKIKLKGKGEKTNALWIAVFERHAKPNILPADQQAIITAQIAAVGKLIKQSVDQFKSACCSQSVNPPIDTEKEASQK